MKGDQESPCWFGKPVSLPQAFCVLTIEIGELSTNQVLQNKSTSLHSTAVPIKHWI